MPQPYYGTDGGAITPVTHPGKGVWKFPQVPDDGDNRDAASVAEGEEALQDEIIWLYHHRVDGISGGSYAADFGWTGLHVFSNNVTFSGALVNFANDVDVDDVLTVGQDVVVGDQLTATTIVTSGNLTVGGNTALIGTFSLLGVGTFNNDVIFNKEVEFNDPVAMNDTFSRAGDDAWESLRSAEGPDANATIQPWKQDVWTTDEVTGNRIWTLANGPTGKVFRVTFLAPLVHTVTLNKADGTELHVLGPSDLAAVTIIWAKTKWRTEALF